MAEEKEKKDLYTFEHWAKKEDGTWKEVENSESIFKDFEPYHCGIPAITEGFTDFELDPEKCDETNNFQKFERNGYTNEITTSKTVDNINYHYSANGQVISGCEKGTVILANHPDHDTIIHQGNYDATISVSGSDDNKELSITGLERPLDKNDFANKVFPKRLGILLVGAGGGAGGGTWYDAKKDGKHDDIVYCSGGSGGGGGIIWGVIDLEKTQTVSIKTTPRKDWLKYWVSQNSNMVNVTKDIDELTEADIDELTEAGLDEVFEAIRAIFKDGPGLGGRNATTSGLTHNSPNKGRNGSLGYSTILYFGNKKIAWANGGGGGAAGHWEYAVGGGAGGDADCDSTYFLGAKKLKGMPGISTQKDMEDAEIANRQFAFQFLTDNTTDGKFSYKINLEPHQTHLATDTSARIPGGHSLGSGAYDDTTAEKGGGGCSNGANGSNNGANGYWIIFYA